MDQEMPPASHSKGEWRISTVETKTRGIDVLGEGGIVASVYLPRYTDQTRSRANARLICAAPDLFEALEWIAVIADKEYEHDEKLRAQGARTLARIADKAKAALTKALIGA